MAVSLELSRWIGGASCMIPWRSWDGNEPRPPRRPRGSGSSSSAPCATRGGCSATSTRGPVPIIGFIDASHDRKSGPRFRGRHLAVNPRTSPLPILGNISRLDELVDQAQATHIVVALSRKPRKHLRPRFAKLSNSRVRVHWVSAGLGRPRPGRARPRRRRPRNRLPIRRLVAADRPAPQMGPLRRRQVGQAHRRRRRRSARF